MSKGYSMFDMSSLSGGTKTTSGKSAGADRDVTPVTLYMPQGTTIGAVYVVAPAVSLASSHAFYEFFRVERWFKIKATKAGESIVIKATKEGGKVKLTAPAWVFTSRGLDLSKVDKPAPKARKAKPAAPPAATVTPPTE